MYNSAEPTETMLVHTPPEFTKRLNVDPAMYELR